MPEVVGLPELLVVGLPLIGVVAAVVELLKALGLPVRWAGVAAIASCAVVVGLLELQERPNVEGVATWLLFSLVYGLGAAGLYSQVRHHTKH